MNRSKADFIQTGSDVCGEAGASRDHCRMENSTFVA